MLLFCEIHCTCRDLTALPYPFTDMGSPKETITLSAKDDLICMGLCTMSKLLGPSLLFYAAGANCCSSLLCTLDTHLCLSKVSVIYI